MSEYDSSGEHRRHARRQSDKDIVGEVKFFKNLATIGAAFLLLVTVFQTGMIVSLWKIRDSLNDIPSLKANVSSLTQSVASLADEMRQLRIQREADIQARLLNRK